MNLRNALATAAVRNIQTAIEWYSNLVGRPPDTRPLDRVAAWQFREGGWLEIFTDPERAGYSTVILAVTSLESQLAELESKGISVRKLEEAEFGEVAIIDDPDGNQIVFAGPLTGVLDD